MVLDGGQMKADFMAHEDGIYFGMPADEYHADPALGSSDMRSLIKGARKYWLRSWRNPYRDRFLDSDTDSSIVGTALHCYTLDGPEDFKIKYMRRPDDAEGATSAQKAAVTKKANEEAKALGKISLHGDDWALCEAAGRIMQTHPDLSEIFTNSMHEVSIFWRDKKTGVRCKMRADILKPAGIGDVKTIANESDAKLETAAKLHIRKYKYPIQGEHYLEGRRQLPRLVKEKRVFIHGKLLPDDAPFAAQAYFQFLNACAQTNKFAYELIFISKALPEVWACNLSPGNDSLTTSRDLIDNALVQYKKYEERFGNQEWPETWRLRELAVEELPGGEFWWT